MSRGIQESDVWEAADALIAQGLRPTIERVRQHIGRGSPNTVSPMLEGWFATLGKRLGVAGGAGANPADAEPEVPDVVKRLAQEMWDTAKGEAETALEMAHAERRRAIDEAQALQTKHEQQLVQREQAIAAQKAAMDEALKLAQTQSQELSRRLDEMQELLQSREASIEGLRHELAQAQAARDAERAQHNKDQEANAQERQRLADQFAGNERRLLAEVDRVRQELTAAKKAAQEQERKAEVKAAQLLEQQLAAEDELRAAQAQLAGSQQAAAIAQERVADLRVLVASLQQQIKDSSAVAQTTAAEEGLARAAAPARSLTRRALSLQKMARAKR